MIFYKTECNNVLILILKTSAIYFVGTYFSNCMFYVKPYVKLRLQER